MNIDETIKRLSEVEPFIMPQIELFEEIRLVQKGTGCMTTLEFVRAGSSEVVAQLELQCEDLRNDLNNEKGNVDSLREDNHDLRVFIRELAPALTDDIRKTLTEKYELLLKRNIIDLYATDKPKIQRNPS